MSSNPTGTLYQQTILWKGVPIRLDAGRAEGKTFIILGCFIRTAALKNEWQEDSNSAETVIRELKPLQRE